MEDFITIAVFNYQHDPSPTGELRDNQLTNL
jgi:hypothetical protein